VALLAAVLFGGAKLRKNVIRYHSFFNESVQGLELGSPVKFRGVTIGNVAAIEVAPDHRMVDVISDLDVNEVTRMGLNESGADGREKFAMPPDLRTQLNSQGITGVKYVSIDFFDVNSYPAPRLPFPVPAGHYIPAAPSMMKNLEDSANRAMDRLPELVDAVVAIMHRVDTLFAVLETQDVSGKVVTSLGRADALMQTLQSTLERIDRHDLGAKAATTFANLDASMGKLNRVLDSLGDPKGLLASAQHATDALGEVGRAGRGTQLDLQRTLRDVSEAAESFRSLVDAIERDPDMLLKGKTPRKVAR
jgi:paraquat-inducible protein B